MEWDRDTLAAAVVGTGGAWLLGFAVFHGRSGRWTVLQVQGMYYAGAGFLMSAAAARWLQHTGPRGMAFSLVGTMLAMRGMYLLVRERGREREARSDATRDGAGTGDHPHAPE